MGVLDSSRGGGDGFDVTDVPLAPLVDTSHLTPHPPTSLWI